MKTYTLTYKVTVPITAIDDVAARADAVGLKWKLFEEVMDLTEDYGGKSTLRLRDKERIVTL